MGLAIRLNRQEMKESGGVGQRPYFLTQIFRGVGRNKSEDLSLARWHSGG
jgi:hypothetical protein